MAPRVTDEHRRIRSRTKEARRAELINGAFSKLLGTIPYIPERQRATVPKIKTLRLAMKYITHLNRLLDGQWAHDEKCEPVRPLQFDDFRFIADDEMKVRNSYRERALQTEIDDETAERIKARQSLMGSARRRRASSTDSSHSSQDSLRQYFPPPPLSLSSGPILPPDCPPTYHITPSTQLPDLSTIYHHPHHQNPHQYDSLAYFEFGENLPPTHHL